MEEEQEKNLFEPSGVHDEDGSVISEDYGNDDYESEDDDDDDEDSDCGSESSLYHLVERKRTFATLNVMILMEYADGHSLRELIDD